MSEHANPEQPKKSHPVRNFALGLAGVMVALIVISSVTNGGGDTGSTGSTDKAAASKSEKKAPKPKPKKTMAGMNQPARDGKFRFVVTQVETGVKRVGDKYFGEEAQGQFVVVSLTVENIGDEARTLDSSSQVAYDQDGRKFDADGQAGISLDSKTFLEEINPGNRVDGKLVFDIPKNATLTTLELHDSAFSGGVKVKLDQ